MKQRQKKWIGIIIALLLAIGIVGCSEEESTTDNSVTKEITVAGTEESEIIDDAVQDNEVVVLDVIEETEQEDNVTQQTMVSIEEDIKETTQEQEVQEVQSEPKAEVKAEEQSQAKSQSEVKVESQPKTEAEVQPEAQVQAEPQGQPEPQVEPEPQGQPEPQVEPEPQVQPEPQVITQQTSSGAYAVNAKNGKIHIVGQCPATGRGDSAMEMPIYFSTYEEAEA